MRVNIRWRLCPTCIVRGVDGCRPSLRQLWFTYRWDGPAMRLRTVLTSVSLAVTTLVVPAARPVAAQASTSYTYVIIGDTPYGAAKLAEFPTLVDRINRDPSVELVAHLGDIKSGSTVCSDGYFAQIRALFDTFQDPLIYTPGDNEWTDCHRTNNGGYFPPERLDALRRTFFPVPGRSLGASSDRS